MNITFFILKYKLKYFQRFILLIIIVLGSSVIFILNGLLQDENFHKIKFLSITTNDCGNDNNCKINIIESLINSNDNNIECKIPNLPIYNPDLMKFYNIADNKSLTCNGQEDWIKCIKSFCSIKEAIKLKEGKITCIYTNIYQRTYDTNIIHVGSSRATDGNYTLKESDFIKVLCQSSKGGSWSGLGVGVRAIPKIKSKTNLKLYNVLILGLDSLSRNAFIRILPKTYEYLTKKLKSNILKGYNIVGDGTQQTLIPLLTGHTELELPDIRKRINGSGYADLYSIIWKYYKKFGYITSFNEDLLGLGIFSYRLNGFKLRPTDHYLKTMYLAALKYKTDKYCIGRNIEHVVMLNYVKNLLASYENKSPTFTFSYYGAVSHDSLNLIGNTDGDVRQWLVDLNEKKLLRNTILILMSDHGNRFTNTLQGKQEERLPFFSFTFPQSFKLQFPKAFKNFQKNLNLLTTPFDIHETLLDLLRLQNLNVTPTFNKHQKTTPARGISLFQVIPKNRSCAMAYIQPHWCSCLKWNNLNATEKFVEKLARNVVEAINGYTNFFRNVCERLLLLRVNWAMNISPNDHLIRFKKSKDIDGFLADMSSEMEIKIDMYELQIIVEPSNATFEAIIGHNPSDNKFYVQMSQIRRIYKHGDGGQANCIYNLYPDLRDYCYCTIFN